MEVDLMVLEKGNFSSRSNLVRFLLHGTLIF